VDGHGRHGRQRRSNPLRHNQLGRFPDVLAGRRRCDDRNRRAIRVINYDPTDWYWQITSSGIYGSARQALVADPLTDAVYLSWKAVNGPGSIAEDAAALDEALLAAGLPASGLTDATKAMLLAYANAKQWALATGDYTITVNSAPLVFPSDVVSMGLITGKAARLAQPNPPASFEWQTPTGFVTIAAADFIAVATQIADFVQSTFNALAVVFAAIEAGTITTTAEIDAATWPSNVSTTPA
jgi:hypothetical protein